MWFSTSILLTNDGCWTQDLSCVLIQIACTACFRWKIYDDSTYNLCLLMLASLLAPHPLYCVHPSPAALKVPWHGPQDVIRKKAKSCSRTEKVSSMEYPGYRFCLFLFKTFSLIWYLCYTLVPVHVRSQFWWKPGHLSSSLSAKYLFWPQKYLNSKLRKK